MIVRTSRSATWKGDCLRAARVDDAGNEALAAHAARGARAELGAGGDLQGGACACHRTGEDRETPPRNSPVATFATWPRTRRSPREGSGGRPSWARSSVSRAPVTPAPRRPTSAAPRRRSQEQPRAAPPGDGDEDGRRARPDEGRGDEARPVRLLHRHRVHPRGVPRDLPGAAGEAAHRRAGDALGEGRQGAGGGVRRRAALGVLRRDRGGGVRRRLDRPGAPRRAARRPRRSR